jgi:phage terminase large subunit
MKIQATELYLKIDEAKKDKRYIFLRGSSRSGKTIAAIQTLIIEALTRPNISITIARATQVSIKNTILIDFKEVLEQMDIFHKGTLNKVDLTYTFENNSVVRFIGLDDTTGKLRGLKSTIAMVDEINTIDRNSFVQLDIRCEDYIIGAYNPEVEEDWWGFDYEKKKNAELIISTFRQNPFLEDNIRQSIMDLKNTDYDLYLIYAEGKVVPPREKIFVQPDTFNEEPRNIKQSYIGLDWGFGNDEAGCVRVDIDGDNRIFVKQLIYDVGLTNEDLIYLLQERGVDKSIEIIADSSEPKSIEELRRKGFKIRGVKKGSGSVLFGIQKMRTYKIFIDESSSDLINEFKNYKFKRDRSGRLTNTPEGKDHLLDALRYVVMEVVDKPKVKYSFM